MDSDQRTRMALCTSAVVHKRGTGRFKQAFLFTNIAAGLVDVLVVVLVGALVGALVVYFDPRFFFLD